VGINETDNKAGRFLSLNEFQLYLSDSNTLGGFNTSTMQFTNGGLYNTQKVYDLDKKIVDNDTDQLLRMDYSQASGSGSGDIAYIDNDKFIGQSANRDVYLYSFFGLPDASDAGFEEWAVQRSAAAVVPLPAAAWMGMALIGGIGVLKKSSSRGNTDV